MVMSTEPNKNLEVKKPVTGKVTNIREDLNQHPQFYDKDSLYFEIVPGKKGGVFNLTKGAKIEIPDSCLGVKDVIKFTVLAPHERWKIDLPELPLADAIISEIFALKASSYGAKNGIFLYLPYKQVNVDYYKVGVKVRIKDKWLDYDTEIEEVDSVMYAVVEVNRDMTLVVTSQLLKEEFGVAINGRLYSSDYYKNLTARFPKKTIDKEILCTLQCFPISPENLKIAKTFNFSDTMDLVAVSELIDFSLAVDANFKRFLTIQLPLPKGVRLEVEGGGKAATSEGQPHIAVYYKNNHGWNLLEVSYKFTGSSVIFDTKALTRYCVVHVVPGRQKRARGAMATLEEVLGLQRVAFRLFLSVTQRSWLAILEAIPKSLVKTRAHERKEAGFLEFTPPDVAVNTKQAKSANKTNHHIVSEGMLWEISLENDLQFTSKSDVRNNNSFRYFSCLDECYRIFFLEPLSQHMTAIEAALTLTPTNVELDDKVMERLMVVINVTLDAELAVTYYTPDPAEQRPQASSKRASRLSQKSGNQQLQKHRFASMAPNMVLKKLLETRRPYRSATETSVDPSKKNYPTGQNKFDWRYSAPGSNNYRNYYKDSQAGQIDDQTLQHLIDAVRLRAGSSGLRDLYTQIQAGQIDDQTLQHLMDAQRWRAGAHAGPMETFIDPSKTEPPGGPTTSDRRYTTGNTEYKSYFKALQERSRNYSESVPINSSFFEAGGSRMGPMETSVDSSKTDGGPTTSDRRYTTDSTEYKSYFKALQAGAVIPEGQYNFRDLSPDARVQQNYPGAHFQEVEFSRPNSGAASEPRSIPSDKSIKKFYVPHLTFPDRHFQNEDKRKQTLSEPPPFDEDQEDVIEAFKYFRTLSIKNPDAMKITDFTTYKDAERDVLEAFEKFHTLAMDSSEESGEDAFQEFRTFLHLLYESPEALQAIDFDLLTLIDEEDDDENEGNVDDDRNVKVQKQLIVPIYERQKVTSAQLRADRESRAISGKSLMTLSRVVNDGLTLAVHLKIPESSITGIGFDGLSNNLSMSDVTYKILIYWKRKCKDKQLGAVTQITEALRIMNYNQLADIFFQCYEQNVELTINAVKHLLFPAE
ncbi:uncharacterized protein LOC131948620 [Physella acuta]|uniref:uncharacterized protein LOC131948620 n=1 Tax=Physella acuta TaxID=109671 RepID=UPI0027DB0C44|nr:uncharacterized protein LOC131948620 [Physella acuta]